MPGNARECQEMLGNPQVCRGKFQEMLGNARGWKEMPAPTHFIDQNAYAVATSATLKTGFPQTPPLHAFVGGVSACPPPKSHPQPTAFVGVPRGLPPKVRNSAPLGRAQRKARFKPKNGVAGGKTPGNRWEKAGFGSKCQAMLGNARGC